MDLRGWLFDHLFADLVSERVSSALRVTDDRWWRPVTSQGAGWTLELSWAERREMLEDCLHEWRTNPLAFRLVALTRAFAVGEGIALRAEDDAVQRFVDAFTAHPQNRLAQRLHRWSDELARAGEVFIVLSRNPGDGMSYVREVPALLIDEVRTDPQDGERELAYHQVTGDLEGRWWPAPGGPGARNGETPFHGAEQVMVHIAVNRPAGAVRGLPDLQPILRWLRRYNDWVEDRARLNKYRAAYLWHCQIGNPQPGELERKRAQYSAIPTPGSILITDDKERWSAVSPNLESEDASADGKAMRLMVAAGAGVPLHFMGEGESATRATAREMGQPTYRHYRLRQEQLGEALREVTTLALWRAGVVPPGEDPGLRAAAEDLTREDLQVHAEAAGEMVRALVLMRHQGWIDDYHAAELALRFAGELYTPEEIAEMLGEAKKTDWE